MLKKSIQVGFPPCWQAEANSYDSFVQKFRDFFLEPYLTVLLNGNGKDLEQTFTRLTASLLEAGVQDLMPRTSFEVANETLDMTEYHALQILESVIRDI